MTVVLPRLGSFPGQLMSPTRERKRSTMNPELAAELADEAQLKAAIRELRKLRKESEPLNRAWSDTRVARFRYEREYVSVVKQLKEREDRIMDELWPYLDKIEALEKQVRKLDRKMRKARA
ncbi:hypothetical protein QZM52_33380 [Burkholderia metallica]|uniref:Uncharacterized protein n=1 Tax=Burkholderia metallica TaxID=488729 RepID=A0ABT8PLX8_9BURK|nr:hypothetical protein [Burkholderia metallica]MDN7936175.1 hypothetical protein [Burkholderia metallica]